MHLHTVGAVFFLLVACGGVAVAATFRIPSNRADYSQYNSIGDLDNVFSTQAALVDGAITIKEGTVFATKGSAAALTLAAPTAGAQSAGGDDNRELEIVDTTGFAHTITTPANKLNGSKHVITMQSGSPLASAVGTIVRLRAYGGVWYMNPGATGVTIS